MKLVFFLVFLLGMSMHSESAGGLGGLLKSVVKLLNSLLKTVNDIVNDISSGDWDEDKAQSVIDRMTGVIEDYADQCQNVKSKGEKTARQEINKLKHKYETELKRLRTAQISKDKCPQVNLKLNDWEDKVEKLTTVCLEVVLEDANTALKKILSSKERVESKVNTFNGDKEELINFIKEINSKCKDYFFECEEAAEKSKDRAAECVEGQIKWLDLKNFPSEKENKKCFNQKDLGNAASGLGKLVGSVVKLLTDTVKALTNLVDEIAEGDWSDEKAKSVVSRMNEIISTFASQCEESGNKAERVATRTVQDLKKKYETELKRLRTAQINKKKCPQVNLKMNSYEDIVSKFLPECVEVAVEDCKSTLRQIESYRDTVEKKVYGFDGDKDALIAFVESVSNKCRRLADECEVASLSAADKAADCVEDKLPWLELRNFPTERENQKCFNQKDLGND